MPVTTIEEVNILSAFRYGTSLIMGNKSGDGNVLVLDFQNQTGYSDWTDAIEPEADYSHLTNQDFIDWENQRLLVEEKRDTYQSVQQFMNQDALEYLRDKLEDTNGNPAELLNLYNQIEGYIQNKPVILRTINTLKTIREVANPTLDIDPSTNQGKAQYLELFLIAVGVWS